MGYHVTCSGAELIRRLCATPENFLGEPHALHMVALCTMVDDEVVDWLLRYEMALDSLTGPDAAFILFYNEAELSAEANYRSNRPNTPTTRIEVAAKLLREGAEAVDEAIGYDARVHRSREVLVRSMTYASDAVGRELGILGRLPCIVLFDEPRSDKFYLIPLDGHLDDTLREIRELLAAYREGEAHSDYFKAVQEWHAVKDCLATTRRISERLKAEYFAPAGRVTSTQAAVRLAEAEDELLAGRQKAFRRRVNLVWPHDPPGITWSEIRRVSDRVARLRRLTSALGRGEEDGVAARASALGVDWPSGDPHGMAEALKREADALTEQLMTKLGRFTETATAGEPEWLRVERACRGLEDLLRRRLEAILRIPRRPVGPYVDKIVAQRKRNSASRIVRLSATTALDRGPNLLDVVSKGINLLSG